TYLRLDLTLTRLFKYLDEKFGKDNFLLFLTSDHAVSYVPSYLVDQGIPGGYINNKENLEALEGFLKEKYGESLLLTFSNFDVFLDRQLIDQKGLDLDQVQKEVARFMLTRDGIAGALPASTLERTE